MKRTLLACRALLPLPVVAACDTIGPDFRGVAAPPASSPSTVAAGGVAPGS